MATNNYPRVNAIRQAIREVKEKEAAKRAQFDAIQKDAENAWLEPGLDIRDSGRGTSDPRSSKRTSSDDSDPFMTPDVLLDVPTAPDFVEKASLDEVQEAAERAIEMGQPGAEKLLREVLDEKQEAVAMEFINSTPEYVADDDNANLIAILQYLWMHDGDKRQHVNADGSNATRIIDSLMERGAWTAENLRSAFYQLLSDGNIPILPAGYVARLNERERRSVLACAISDSGSAITLALRYQLGADRFDALEAQMKREGNPTAVLSNPELSGALFEAVMLVFGQIQQDYRETEEARQYIADFIGSRVPSIQLCQAAWEAYKREGNRQAQRQSADETVNPAVTAQALDEMDDDQISDLYASVIRERAQQLRGR